MADLGATFVPDEVPPDERNFDPLTPGDYVCQIIESDVVPTKSGTGERLTLTLEVLEGPHANRRLWDGLNIRNDNAQAQSIAQRALADLCQAIGVGAIRDSEELHFRPFVARVGLDKNDPERNVVKRYRPHSGSLPAAKPVSAPPRDPSTARSTFNSGSRASSAAPPAQARSAPARSAAGNRPWNRRPVDSEVNDDIPF